LTVAGREYEARIRALPERYGKNEYLAIVVPTAEIIEPITAIRTETLIYSAAVLVLALPLYAILIVVWLDRHFARRPKYVAMWPTEEEEVEG
jgi:hypothetical protein